MRHASDSLHVESVGAPLASTQATAVSQFFGSLQAAASTATELDAASFGGVDRPHPDATRNNIGMNIRVLDMVALVLQVDEGGQE
jgi:hypothetical protein